MEKNPRFLMVSIPQFIRQAFVGLPITVLDQEDMANLENLTKPFNR